MAQDQNRLRPSQQDYWIDFLREGAFFATKDDSIIARLQFYHGGEACEDDTSCLPNPNTTPNFQTPMIHEFTNANFFATQLASKPVLVDFFATWCGPCKRMLEVLPQVASEIGNAGIVGKLDVDTSRAIATQYQIKSLPTLILFHRGETIKRWVGVQSVAELADAMRNVLNTSSWNPIPGDSHE